MKWLLIVAIIVGVVLLGGMIYVLIEDSPR